MIRSAYETADEAKRAGKLDSLEQIYEQALHTLELAGDELDMDPIDRARYEACYATLEGLVHQYT
jgi:hypothetical protein